MTFMCTECGFNSLQIQEVLELPPDTDHDEITLQTVACGRCGLKALALYTESRRGAFGSESWRHEGYRVSDEDFERARQAIRACPSPRNASCDCAVHEALGATHEGRWVGLRRKGVAVQEVFVMKWADDS